MPTKEYNTEITLDVIPKGEAEAKALTDRITELESKLASVRGEIPKVNDGLKEFGKALEKQAMKTFRDDLKAQDSELKNLGKSLTFVSQAQMKAEIESKNPGTPD